MSTSRFPTRRSVDSEAPLKDFVYNAIEVYIEGAEAPSKTKYEAMEEQSLEPTGRMRSSAWPWGGAI